MKSFGALLRIYIERSGYTIYGIAQKAGVNRTTLQKVLSEERTPSEEFMERLLPLLKLTPKEGGELRSVIEIIRTGETVYAQRQHTLKMLEAVSLAIRDGISFTSAGQNNTPDGSRRDLKKIDKTLYQGHYGVEHLLIDLLQEECRHAKPELMISAPANLELFRNLFMHGLHYCARIRQLTVRQLLVFIKTPDQSSAPIVNLDILSNVLPFIAVTGFHYDVSYCYGNQPPADMSKSAFPYYIIFSDVVVLLSPDCSAAMPCAEPSVVGYFKDQFEAALCNTSPLVTACPKPDQILEHIMRTDSEGFPLYALEYQPCFPVYLTEPLLRKYVKPNLPFYRSALDLFLKRIRQLQSITCHTCVFSKRGLLSFTETGLLADLPPQYTDPLSIQDRIYLLEELYKATESDRQVHRMVNPAMFPISEYLVCILHQNIGIDFNGFGAPQKNYNYIHITERTLLDAFADFFEYLVQSPLVYSKEETLLYIKECILMLKPCPSALI